MSSYDFPQVQKHGQLKELFKDVYYVQGSVKMAGPLPVRFSRNMTVIREGKSLVLVNTVRLDDAGLAALDKLGKVEHVIRLAGFHGMDDPFYKDRYKAKVWAVKGQTYVKGFDASAPTTYFKPDVEMDEGTKPPLADSRLFRFSSAKPSEGLLLMEREGGIIVSGDSLQNWHQTDEYFNGVAKFMMKVMGFIKPHNLGPGWLKQAKPKTTEVRSVLDLNFNHLLPAHGAPVIGGARESYRKVIEALK